MTSEAPYTETLKSLALQGLSFRCIGTFALKFLLPDLMTGYELKDADIVLENTPENLRLFIRSMKEAAWQVKVWEDEVNEETTPESLKGKFYLRCSKGELVLDATYECPISFPQLCEKGQYHNGIPLAGLPQILELKKLRGKPEDFELLSKIP